MLCDGDQDFIPDDGDLWKETTCKTVFDNVEADEEPDWESWWWGMRLLHNDIRHQRWQQRMDERARTQQLEEMVKAYEAAADSSA